MRSGATKPRVVPTALRVSDVSALGLRAADRGGTSDPYVVFSCANNSFASPVLEKTLAPAWLGFECQFRGRDIDAVDTLSVSVYDHDRFTADDLLGALLRIRCRYPAFHMLMKVLQWGRACNA